MYRALLKPWHVQLIAAIKAQSDAKVLLHSDGNVYQLIDDFIARHAPAGVEAPAQLP